MKILSENDVVSWYYTLSNDVVMWLNLLMIVLLIIALIGIFGVLTDGFMGSISSVTCAILFFVGLVGFSIFAMLSPNDKPHTIYKATVSDWNEVHEGGYKVVEQEGELVTLKKYHEGYED